MQENPVLNFQPFMHNPYNNNSQKAPLTFIIFINTNNDCVN